MSNFKHYDLRFVEPLFASDLTDSIINLEHLRKRRRLGGTTHPAIFFQLKNVFHFLESIGSARIEGNNTTIAEYIGTKIDPSIRIEADDSPYSALSHCYAENDKIVLRKGFVSEENINRLFREAGVPEDFELLSIDIDSVDYYVWRGLTEFQPKIVIIEYNSSYSPDVEYVVAKEDAIRLSGTS